MSHSEALGQDLSKSSGDTIQPTADAKERWNAERAKRWPACASLVLSLLSPGEPHTSDRVQHREDSPGHKAALWLYQLTAAELWPQNFPGLSTVPLKAPVALGLSSRCHHIGVPSSCHHQLLYSSCSEGSDKKPHTSPSSWSLPSRNPVRP